MSVVVWLEVAFAAGTCTGVVIGWLSARIVDDAEHERVLLSAVEILESLEGKTYV